MDHPNDQSPYDLAVDSLALAVEAVWRACDAGWSETRPSGRNLPEALSYALGVVGRKVTSEWVATEEPGWAVETDLAKELLVRHRPGSWEAAHLRHLMLPIEYLPEGPS